jgi:hypothetical protein
MRVGGRASGNARHRMIRWSGATDRPCSPSRCSIIPMSVMLVRVSGFPIITALLLSVLVSKCCFRGKKENVVR